MPHTNLFQLHTSAYGHILKYGCFFFFFSCNYSSTVVYNKIKNQSGPVAAKTSLNRLKDHNWTVVDRLPPVQSGLSQKKGQFGPVAVHGCPFLEAKTRLNWTFIHYQWPMILDDSHANIIGSPLSGIQVPLVTSNSQSILVWLVISTAAYNGWCHRWYFVSLATIIFTQQSGNSWPWVTVR